MRERHRSASSGASKSVHDRQDRARARLDTLAEVLARPDDRGSLVAVAEWVAALERGDALQPDEQRAALDAIARRFPELARDTADAADTAAIAREIALDAAGLHVVDDGDPKTRADTKTEEPVSAAAAYTDLALDALARAFGLTAPARADARLDAIFDDDPTRALQTAGWLEALAGQLDLDVSGLSVRVDDVAARRTAMSDASGLYDDGVIYLDPDAFRGESAADEALLAHELAHAAQAQRAADGDEMAGLGHVEAEAFAVMEDVAAGRSPEAPRLGLAPEVEAACGPRSMQEARERDEDPEPKPTIDPEPDPGPDPTPPPRGEEPPKKEDDPPPSKEPEPIDDPKPVEDDAGECLDACPDPAQEHRGEAKVRTPAPAKPGDGKIITLTLAGHQVKVRLPADAQPGAIRVQLRDADSPYEALRLRTALIQVDADWNVTGGAIHGGVKLGKFIHADAVSLAIKRGGGVALAIKQAKLAVGDKLKGTIDLNIGRRGISGEVTLRSGQIAIGDGLVVKDGYLRVKVFESGKVDAHGRLTVGVPNLGEVTLDACFIDGEFRGEITLTWTRTVTLFPGVVLEKAQLRGCYRQGGWSVHGMAQLEVAKTFGATIKASYWHGGGAGVWEVQGTVKQREDINVGALKLHKGHANVHWKRDHWEPATAGFEFAWQQVKGSVQGTWDIAERKLDATGEAHLDEPLPLGDTGARIEEASLEAEIKQNVPVHVKGDVSLLFQRKGVDTFKVDAEATYVFATKQVDATGSVEVLEDLVFGDPKRLHGIVDKGSKGAFTMAKSEVVHLGGGVTFRVNQGAHEIGTGGVTFNGGRADRLNGEARFSLTNRTGVPNVDSGPFFLLPGGEFVLPIKDSRPTKASAANVRWELLHPEAGSGKVAGAVAGDYDFTSGEANLAGDARVVETWRVLSARWGEVELTEGGDGRVGVTSSRLSELGGELPFRVKVNAREGAPGFELEGRVDATVAPKSWKVSGGFDAQLVSALEVPIGDRGDAIVVKAGSTFDGTLTNSEPRRLGLDIDLEYHRAGEGLFLAGKLGEGSYDVARGHFSVGGELTLKKAVAVDTPGGWKLQVEPEVTTLDVAIKKNQLTRIAGDVELTLWDGEEPLLKGSLTNARYDLTQKSPEFSGDLSLQLARDVSVPRDGAGLPPAVALTALQASGLSGVIRKNKLDRLAVDLQIDAALSGEKVGEAKLAGTWDVKSGAITGEGSVALTEDVPVAAPAMAGASEPEGWQLVFKRDSAVALSMKANALQPATVDIQIGLCRADEEVAQGAVSGLYLFGDEGGFTGQIGFEMVTDVHLADADRFGIFLGGATTASGEIVKSGVKTAAGTFELLAKEGGVDKLSATLELTYTGGKFNGEAALEAVDTLRLGERAVGDKRFTVDLAQGSGGKLAIADNAPGLASGDLTVDVGMDDVPFARGVFDANYDFSKKDAKVNCAGSLEVIGQAELGTVGQFTFILEAGTGVSGAIKDNALEFIEGALELGLATEREGRVGSLSLQGRYEGGEKPNFGGEASAIIDKGFLLGYQAYGYEFGFAPSSFTATLSEGQLTAARSDLTVLAQQFAGDDEAPLGTITLQLKGDYTRPLGAAQGSFTGEGTCAVDGQLRVGEAAEYAFFVLGGSDVAIWVVDNRFTKLHGGLEARVDQLSPEAGEDTELLELACEVTYVPEDGGRIDASGACAMIGRKMLLALDGYEFWLIAGQGASAKVEIVDNTLVSVGGTVSCAVYDGDPRPLINAHAQGTWVRETNLFNGSGDIRLGRDVTFPKGKTAGPRVVFREGSGGGGVVENNEIKRLTGKLACEIHDDKGELIFIDATGEYDAVNNDVVWAKGAVSLLRPIVIGDAGDPLLVIEQVQAEGEVKHSELVGVAGALDFKVPRLWNLGGKLQGGWTNRSGEDEYWGQANITFAAFDDPEAGKKLNGELSGQFNKDGTWRVGGDVKYQLTPYLKTDAHVDLDQEVDPSISAGFDIAKMPILDARELFGFNATLFTMSAGLLSGGVSAGLSMKMHDLLFSTNFNVTDWRPLSEKSETPEINAALKVDWGLDFQAKVAAYIMLGLDVFIASIGAGVEGAAALDVAMPLHLGGTLKGGEDGLAGELDLQVALKAFVTLSATPFVKASFLWWEWDKDWPFTHKMGPVFEWSWGKRYHFGDQEKPPTDLNADANAVVADDGKEESFKQDATQDEVPPRFADDKKPGPLPKRPGAPAMNPATESRGAEAPKEQGGMPGPMGDKMQLVEPLMAFLGVVSKELKELQPVFDCIKDEGFIVLVLRIFFDRGFPGWDAISGAVLRMFRAAQKAWAQIGPMLMGNLDPELYNALDALLGPKPSLLQALFGADDMVRDEVDKGTHRKLDAKGRARFIEIMMDGYCGDADEARILTVLRYSGQQGDIRAVVAQTEGGVKRIVYKIDGAEYTQLKRIFDRYGVDY